MKKTLSRGLLASATLVTLLLPACASTHSGGPSEVSVPAGYTIEKMVVVGFTDDESVRQKFEDGFAQRMTTLGADTETSFEIMPDLDDLSDDDALQETKQKTGADTSVLVEVVKENKPAKQAQGVLFGVWVAGVLSGDATLRSAGAWGGLAASDAAADYKMRVTLWNMSDDSLLWSMDTDTYKHDLGKTGNSAAKLAELVHERLQKDGLL